MPVDTARWGEHGFSLVESVIAVAVLGIIVTAMVGGMATSIATSALHRDQSADNAVMVSAAEAIKSAPYDGCESNDPALPYSAKASAALPAGWPGAITVTVQYWNPQTLAWDPPSRCHDTEISPLTPPVADGVGGPFPMQLVTILVTRFVNAASASGPIKTSVDIVKRGP